MNSLIRRCKGADLIITYVDICKVINYFIDIFMFIQEALPLLEVCKLGLDCPESGWNEEDGPKETLAAEAADLLQSKASMLRDYFSLDIDDQGNLATIPMLLGNIFLFYTYLF